MADLQNDIPTQIQRLAFEAGIEHKSEASRPVQATLRAVHRDLPEMAERSIGYLANAGIDVASSRATSHRLGDALLREAAAHGPERMNGMEMNSAMRNAMRSTLVQEAAAGEYELRSGRRDVLSQFLGDRGPTQAEAATASLKRQGVDTDRLFANASLEDTRMMASGSFGRLSGSQRDVVARTLEVPREQIADGIIAEPSMARAVPTAAPVRQRPEPAREIFAHAPRAPGFGRRGVAAFAQAQSVGAGR